MLTSPAPLLVVISAIVALALTGNLLDASPYVIAPQAIAVALSVWARRSFPKNTFRVAADPGASSVIRRGPYRFVRHPMYSAALLFIWAAILSHVSPWTLALGVFVTLVVWFRLIAEERLLRTRYSEYSEYARSTKALIPFVL
jgi:protein-S-isoprenylcysteine O-methyltransferase Ste14